MRGPKAGGGFLTKLRTVEELGPLQLFDLFLRESGALGDDVELDPEDLELPRGFEGSLAPAFGAAFIPTLGAALG